MKSIIYFSQLFIYIAVLIIFLSDNGFSMDEKLLYNHDRPDSILKEVFPRIKAGIGVPFILNIKSSEMRFKSEDFWCCRELTTNTISFSSGLNLNSGFLWDNIPNIPYFDSLA